MATTAAKAGRCKMYLLSYSSKCSQLGEAVRWQDDAMAKFGHVLISGLVWIAIAVGIGALGLWMAGAFVGLWSIIGWLLTIIGFGFAVMSGLLLWRTTSLQIKGLRMMREDPEGFAEAKRRYEQSMSRISGSQDRADRAE